MSKPQYSSTPILNSQFSTLNSIYWYDYETFGMDPRRDRVAQFAGIRTDENLRIIGEPLVLYCKPADDFLPLPEACLITGITPQIAVQKGVVEAEFIRKIHNEFSRPKTCVAGYNNIRFDDEFTRNLLYRNFFDPYAREWQNGNSRWDIIDMVRLTRALRPEGIAWPVNDDGSPSFRLELLTAANHIEHLGAHDALADIYATIALARLIKERQPRLFDFVYQLRDKQKIAALLDLNKQDAVLHVSNKYPASSGSVAIVAPVAAHPRNRNEIIVLDLRLDPQILLDMDSFDIRQKIFTRTESLPAGEVRLPLKTVRINRAPVIVPLSTLTAAAEAEWRLDKQGCLENLEMLRRHKSILIEKLQAVFADSDLPPADDPDLALYSGGFFSDADRARMNEIRKIAPEDLANLACDFDDARLPEMLFRYRARNYPETLTPAEQTRWQDYRRQKLVESMDENTLTLEKFRGQLATLRESRVTAREQALLTELAVYADGLAL